MSSVRPLSAWVPQARAISAGARDRDLVALEPTRPFATLVAYLASLTFVGLALVLPFLAITSSSARVSFPVTVLPITLLLVWSSAKISLFVVRSARRPMSLGFWLYVYLWLGLSPLVQVTTGTFPYPSLLPGSALLTASLLALVGVAAYEVLYVHGYLRGSGRALSRPRQERVVSWRGLSSLVAVSLVLCLILVPKLGGLGSFFASRQALDVASLSLGNGGSFAVQAIYLSLLSVPPLVGLIAWYWLSRNGDVRRPTKAVRFVTLAVLIALNVVVNNPISQPRSWVGVIAFGFLFLACMRWRVVMAGLLVFVLLAFVVILPRANAFRFTSQSRDTAPPSLYAEFAESGDFDSFQEIATGVQYVRANGYAFGGRVEGPLLFWVPRSIWSSKPRDTGNILGEFGEYPNTNLSAPLWVETYMDGGPIWTVVVFGLFGAASRRLDDIFETRGAQFREFGLAVLPFVGLYELSVLRGSLLTVTGRLVVLTGAVWLVSRKSRVLTPGDGVAEYE